MPGWPRIVSQRYSTEQRLRLISRSTLLLTKWALALLIPAIQGHPQVLRLIVIPRAWRQITCPRMDDF